MFELRQVEAADHSDERTAHALCAASISLRNQIRMTDFYCQMFVLKKNKPKTNSLNVYIPFFNMHVSQNIEKEEKCVTCNCDTSTQTEKTPEPKPAVNSSLHLLQLN